MASTLDQITAQATSSASRAGWLPLDELPEAQLAGPDIWDESEYVIRRGIPILDVHRHDDKGTVDRGLLELIAANSNARSARGDYALIFVGHTDPDLPEMAQPPIVGYISEFIVGRYDGRPCLLADFHYKKAKFDLAMSFPHRSIERAYGELPQSNFISAVALLRFRPERPLGLMTYSDQSVQVAPPTPRPSNQERSMTAIRDADVRLAARNASLEAQAARLEAQAAKIAALNLRMNRDERGAELKALARQGIRLEFGAELARCERMSVVQYSAHVASILKNYARSPLPAAAPALGWSSSPATMNEISRQATDEAKGIYRYARDNKIGPSRFADAVAGYRAEKAKLTR